MSAANPCQPSPAAPDFRRVRPDGTVYDRYWQREVTDPVAVAEITARADAQDARITELVAAAERGRRTYVRFGLPPASGQSTDSMNNCTEAGVSVYAAWIDGATVYIDRRDSAGAGAMMFLSGRDLYEVIGTRLVVTGADGEPLLANVTAHRIKGEVIDIPANCWRAQ